MADKILFYGLAAYVNPRPTVLINNDPLPVVDRFLNVTVIGYLEQLFRTGE